MEVRVVVQARIGSSRLPGKAMLTLKGRPLVRLVCERAAQNGRGVILATTELAEDDVVAQQWPRVVRGSENDVLDRFLLATRDMDDASIVVRLTADNPVVDAEFIEGLVDELVRCGGGYVGTDAGDTGLPYGLSAEAFTVAALREAAKSDPTPFDREHVTPAIRRRCGVQLYAPEEVQPEWGAVRCTIDALDDYLRVERAFEGLSAQTPWQNLVEFLALRKVAPIPRSAGPTGPHGRLVLGTVQLGMVYGSVQKVQPPEPDEADAIVREAIEAGVTHIDTARAYGSSEEVLGRALRGSWTSRVEVVTKLDPLIDVPAESQVIATELSVHRSLRALGLGRLPTLLLHRADHRQAPAVWETLLRLREQGLIGRLGASVSSPDQALSLLADPDVTHLQLPFNILDTRWSQVAEALTMRPDVVIHTRSAYLQGILLRGPEAWPAIEGLNPGEVLAWLDRLGPDRAATCLGTVLAQPWIHGAVVGIERLAQLHQNLELVRARTHLDLAEIEASRPAVPSQLLDPAQWPRVNP